MGNGHDPETETKSEDSLSDYGKEILEQRKIVPRPRISMCCLKGRASFREVKLGSAGESKVS